MVIFTCTFHIMLWLLENTMKEFDFITSAVLENITGRQTFRSSSLYNTINQIRGVVDATPQAKAKIRVSVAETCNIVS